MTPQVLIVAGLYDFSADLVCLRLGEVGVPFLRLNREHFPELRITLDPLERTLSVAGRGIKAHVGPECRSVWFRQPVFLRNTPGEALTPAAQLSRSQWTAFTRALCTLDKAAWMNHPQATYLAETKPWQLALAHECGFQVPATLVTNDASAIRTRFPGDLIIKSLDTVLLRENDDCLFTYTTIADGASLSDEDTQDAPLLAQTLVEAKTDLRITVVGERMFAVRILADGAGVHGDWRLIPRESLSYQDVVLPTDVALACRTLVDRMGLAFAAIDLVETDAGMFFIEVNPTGEWGWLVDQDRRIDQAVADWLAQPGMRGS